MLMLVMEKTVGGQEAIEGKALWYPLDVSVSLKSMDSSTNSHTRARAHTHTHTHTPQFKKAGSLDRIRFKQVEFRGEPPTPQRFWATPGWRL